MGNLFTSLFSIVAVPFGYVMRFIYEFVGSYGLSIFLFAALTKVLMIPLTVKQKRSMLRMQSIQPKQQELQRKYGKDQQRYSQELQDLYAREGVSPMSGCGSTLLSFPIMLGLYYVISQPLTYFMQLTADQIAQIAEKLGVTMSGGYGAQIALAGEIFNKYDLVSGISDKIMKVDFNFLGINLAAVPNFREPGLLWVIPILSGLTALAYSLFTQWSTKRNNPAASNDQAAKTNMMMMLMSPLMSLYFGFVLPAGLGVYWISNNILMIVTDLIVMKHIYKQDPPVVDGKKVKKKDELN